MGAGWNLLLFAPIWGMVGLVPGRGWLFSAPIADHFCALGGGILHTTISYDTRSGASGSGLNETCRQI